MIFRWPLCGPERAPCAWRTVPTKCIANRSPSWSCRATGRRLESHVERAFQILARSCDASLDRACHEFVLQRGGVGAALSRQTLPGVLRHAGELLGVSRRGRAL